ncbi:MAG: DCC1-like thiol-disulfide oxidoreductase family protein [Bacteroidota bacterium]|nr:DCC1-like thiol-disulfide oxidoreductase family protein [Bacteroidota bacterium]
MNVVFFDGVCNLCSNSVKFIIKNDSKNLFKFSSLQSKYAIETFENYPEINTSKLQSIILKSKDNQIYTQSTAVLKIAYHLRFPINLLVVFIIIPKTIRDWIYQIIAKRRYKWFGKKEVCWLPNPELATKFID